MVATCVEVIVLTSLCVYIPMQPFSDVMNCKKIGRCDNVCMRTFITNIMESIKKMTYPEMVLGLITKSNLSNCAVKMLKCYLNMVDIPKYSELYILCHSHYL